jgi:hypothetical protein
VLAKLRATSILGDLGVVYTPVLDSPTPMEAEDNDVEEEEVVTEVQPMED